MNSKCEENNLRSCMDPPVQRGTFCGMLLKRCILTMNSLERTFLEERTDPLYPLAVCILLNIVIWTSVVTTWTSSQRL